MKMTCLNCGYDKFEMAPPKGVADSLGPPPEPPADYPCFGNAAQGRFDTPVAICQGCYATPDQECLCVPLQAAEEAEQAYRGAVISEISPKNLEALRRKGQPVTTGVLDYFPDALLAVAECSRAGNDQHNPGQPLHWAKEKSTDEADALVRHLMERGTLDTDGIRHSAKVAWRALALLQRELDSLKNP